MWDSMYNKVFTPWFVNGGGNSSNNGQTGNYYVEHEQSGKVHNRLN